jgi:hypothetical protein
MTWLPSSRRLPGAQGAQPFSRFAALADAAPARVLDTPVAVPPLTPAPPMSAFGTAWERGTTASLALTRDISWAPPDAATTWQSVSVPDNYGLDPDLRQYFGPVWYRRRITRPAGTWADLAFAAADYFADVHLDRVPLGRHEGCFAPFLFDISEHLAAGESAELLVRVQDPLEPLKDRRLFTRHRKRWIKGVLNYHDSRAGGMPGLMTPGWTAALGQSPPTGGLVGPVTIEASGPFRIDAVFVTPLDTAGHVHVCVLGVNRATVLEATLVLALRSPDEQTVTSAVRVLLPAGAIRVDLETTVDEPVLWWDAALPEHGTPALYTLQAHMAVDGAVSSQRGTTFGLRIAEFPVEPAWRYVLNGIPAFMRAVNYIPVQHWARLDDAFYDRDFALMRAAHVCSAGVHAHVQSPACYRAADRAGISLIQDFPLQWSYASGTREDPTFVPRATAMAAEMACLLWNHPSVVAYTAHNEPVHALRDMVRRQLDARAATSGRGAATSLGLGRRLVERVLFPMADGEDETTDRGNEHLDRRLAATLTTVDPTRFVHAASATGHDVHVYAGTIGGGSVFDVGLVRAPFVSEYGSFPVGRRSHARHDGWATPWPPGKPQVRALSRQGLIAAEALGAAGEITRYKDLSQLAAALERKAAFVAQYQTEFFRIHRGDPYAGCRWHFFVNHWGYMGGGLLDVDRHPTQAYHALAAALRPRLAAALLGASVFAEAPPRLPVFAMNDRGEAWQARVAWQLESLSSCDVLRGGRSRHAPRLMPPPDGTYVLPPVPAGTVMEAGTLEAASPYNATVPLGELRFTTLSPGPYRLVLAWDDDGRREENVAAWLVTRREWTAPVGLTRVTAADVS